MSTRSQVYLPEIGVYLYQHMDGYNLAQEVQIALSKKDRWDDPEYLARIIFCTMLKENEAFERTTGYGIGTEQHGDIEYLITVDTTDQTVKVSNGYGSKWTELFKGSFDEFLRTKVSAGMVRVS